MTIEINRNSEYTYRVNPYNSREIDRRKNMHGARWERFAIFDTPEEATAALLALRSDPYRTSPVRASTREANDG